MDPVSAPLNTGLFALKVLSEVRFKGHLGKGSCSTLLYVQNKKTICFVIKTPLHLMSTFATRLKVGVTLYNKSGARERRQALLCQVKYALHKPKCCQPAANYTECTS